jgi:hypothetical protein
METVSAAAPRDTTRLAFDAPKPSPVAEYATESRELESETPKRRRRGT